jgi:hypothetical protein
MVMIFQLFVFLSLYLQAAPHPGVGSSALNQVDKNIFFSQMGFKLNVVPAGWELLTTADNDANKELQIEIGKNFSMTNDHIGRISFKAETTKVKVDLENYVKKFLRDYNQYGFDVSGLQSLREKNIVIVDINQKNKKTRSRQMFFQNGTRIVTATCADEFENFDKTITECNQIFGHLVWR